MRLARVLKQLLKMLWQMQLLLHADAVSGMMPLLSPKSSHAAAAADGGGGGCGGPCLQFCLLHWLP
jgi:hypothetical protein